MGIHIHVHLYGDKELFTEIKSINSKIEIMSEKLDAINAQLAAINDSTNNIAADLDRLASQIAGGLSAEEADSVVSQLTATSDKLKVIAAINPEPGDTAPAPTA